MNLVEALKLSPVVRRSGKPSHVGSNGTGWVFVEYLLSVPGFLTYEDILADDWEASEEYKDSYPGY